MMPMIQARDLTRRFETRTEVVEAVRGLSLDVAEGELVAFLGPNGAGKSTSVRMLTTLLPPSSGSARVAGHDVVSEPAAVRRNIGYVGQRTAAGPYHRVRDELVTQGRAQRMGRAQARARADLLLALLELDGLADRLASTLSGGQKRRLDVALGLMHAPPILFLDEPSTGLDPHSRANLWKHILELRRTSGTTIFLTTHYLEEADAMAERVMVMDHGTVIANDTPARLKAELAGDRIRIELTRSGETPRAAEIARNLPAARELEAGETSLAVTVKDGEAALPELIRHLQQRGIEVAAATVKRPTLDDVFLGLTGRSLREQAAA
jgi:ABC-2 type transport system ATP-binding protein